MELHIVAGRGIVRDIEGNSYDLGPGDVVYGPPGMRGAHEWEVKETLRLLTIKATNAPERAIHFHKRLFRLTYRRLRDLCVLCGCRNFTDRRVPAARR